MSQKLFHIWYRREFACDVWAEDEVAARAAAQGNGSWRVLSETGELWDEFLEVSKDD